ncbi:MAG: hypothetical protein IPL61_32535 [Myxococcales bacterium]|nr:hypothetical protein [Myxococcales bacterium]
MTDGPDTRSELTITLPGVTRAGAKAIVDKVPVLGTIIKVLRDSEANIREHRRERWAQWLVGSDSEAETFAADLEKALGGDHGMLVREAVNESVRAALEAVDEIVVPSLALLTRRYLKTRTPDRRTYRELINILRALDEAEFCALRRAIHRLGWTEGDPLTTVIMMDSGAAEVAEAIREGNAGPDTTEVWNWYTTNRPKTRLILGELAPRIVAALEPLQGGFYAIYREPQRGRHKPRFPRALVQLMVDILPEPPEPPASDARGDI